MDEAVKKLKGEGIEVVGTAAHVGSKADVERLVKLAIDSFGKIDLVVSNAAVNPSAGLILDMPDSAIQKILEINVFSPILLLKEVRPYLKKVRKQPDAFSVHPTSPSSTPISCSPDK